MSTPDHDVVIAGAGSAGCAAAAILAPHANVLLVDSEASPDWRIGETLPGAAHRLLHRIDAWGDFVKAGHASAPLRISRWGAARAETLDAFRDPDGVGWRLDRVRFEQDLRRVAVAKGASARWGASLSVQGWTRAGWQLLLTDGTSVSARVLLDASGRQSRLLRPFGQKRLVTDQLACAWYLSDHNDPTADPSIYTHAVPQGWWYSARVGGGRRLVAFHSDADLPALKQILRGGVLVAARQVPELAEMIVDIPAGEVGTQGLCSAASIARSAAGPGWLALGDATLAFDPLSSQGLFNALATGIEAGETVLRALGGEDAQALWTDYASRIGQIWQAYAHHLRLFYAMERRWLDSPFWQRRQAAFSAAKPTG